MSDSKLIFFDIDGTLWDFKNIIPDSTKEACKKLKENGHQIFLCSGRSRGYIHNPTLLGLGFDGIISACGTMIEYRGQEVFYKGISPEKMAEAIRIVREYGLKPILEGKRFLYLEEYEFAGDLYYEKIKRDMEDAILSIDGNWGEWEVSKFSCATTDCDTKSCFKLLENDYDFIVHNEHVAEIVPKGYDKSVGIDWLVEYLKADIKDTFAFGDSVNDEGMIKTVNIGIVMGNGMDEVKKIADYVTDPMKEDGIYKACEHFGLI